MNDLERLADALARRTLIDLVPQIGQAETLDRDHTFAALCDVVLAPDAPIAPAALPPIWQESREFHAVLVELGALLRLLPTDRADAWLTLLAAEIVEASLDGAASRIMLEQIAKRHGAALPQLAVWIQRRYPNRSVAADVYDVDERLRAERATLRERENDALRNLQTGRAR